MARASHDPRGVQRGYALGTLFLLTAAVAALLAVVTSLLRGRVGEEIGGAEFARSIAAGAVGMAILGVLVGLFHFGRTRNALWGMLVGIGLGACCGPLVFVPAEKFSLVWLLAAAGAGVMLAVAAAIRAAGDGWHKRGLAPARQRAKQVKPHPLDEE